MEIMAAATARNFHTTSLIAEKIERLMCLTWDETIGKAVIGNCPYFPPEVTRNYLYYSIPANVNLSYFICSKFNRQGTHCKECIDGYGPAPFLNGANIPCAKYHKHNYIWIFYLLNVSAFNGNNFILFYPIV